MKAVAKLTLATALLAGSGSAAMAVCDTGGMRSPGTNDQRLITVRNAVPDRSAKLYWIDFQGNKKLYATIPPNGSHTQQTYIGHIWTSENSYGYCDIIFTVQNNAEIIIK